MSHRIAHRWSTAVMICLAVVASLLSIAPAAGQDSGGVSPDVDLTDGQLVQVDGPLPIPPGVGPFGTEIDVCVDGTDDCVNVTSVPAPVTPVREARVVRYVDTPTGVVDCADVSCSFVYRSVGCVAFTGFPFLRQCARYDSNDVSYPLRFSAGAGVGTFGAWQDGATVRVVGTDLATGERAAAVAIQCAFLDGGGFSCGTVGSIEPNFDGSFDGAIEIVHQFDSPDGNADCLVDDCVIGVLVLGPRFEILDVALTQHDLG